MSEMPDRMTPEEAVAALDALKPGNKEGNHPYADRVLLAVVPPEVAAAWQRAQDRDDGWWWE